MEKPIYRLYRTVSKLFWIYCNEYEKKQTFFDGIWGIFFYPRIQNRVTKHDLAADSLIQNEKRLWDVKSNPFSSCGYRHLTSQMTNRAIFAYIWDGWSSVEKIQILWINILQIFSVFVFFIIPQEFAQFKFLNQITFDPPTILKNMEIK